MNNTGIFDPTQVRQAIWQSIRMLSPRALMRNPVMFVAAVGAVISTLVTAAEIVLRGPQAFYFLAISALLWLTVLFANFAEALAEARGKAHAASLRQTRGTTQARKVVGNEIVQVSSHDLKPDDIVLVAAGDIIPADGEVVDGIASVDESAITGESAPVIRAAGGDRSGVTGGTTVVSDELTIRVTVLPGDSFLDQMIALVEGATRQKTPNELALTVVLAGLTLTFLVVVAALLPIGRYFGVELDVPTLVALLVCLIPTTIGALLSAIGIAGMDRALQAHIVSKSGKAVELAGDIDTLLVDKTGTITVGDRQATDFVVASGVDPLDAYCAALLGSRGDQTSEGTSIRSFALDWLQRMASDKTFSPEVDTHDSVIEFSAHTRLSGVDTSDGAEYRKGAFPAIRDYLTEQGGTIPGEIEEIVNRIASMGQTPVVVASQAAALGVIGLSDVLKESIRDKVHQLQQMGLRVVMITGDNPLTAAAIAADAGVDDYIAEATPQDKLAYIQKEQEAGRLVAMMGDGTNDAPALAQADIGIAMNSGTQAAKEAANMVDLDSDPTKLLHVIEIGKQLLITRGALTTFSIANDVAKYFAIVPAMFTLALPQLAFLNVMGLATPFSAILSAVIFNAIIIPLLIPIALRGVRFRSRSASHILTRNVMVYGVGGLIAPFIGIKLIDVLISAIGVI